MYTAKEDSIKNYMDKNPKFVKAVIITAIRALLDATVEVILQWRKENSDACEADCISQCNLQMATLTVESILTLANGIHWSKYKTDLIDVNACASLVRSLYERAFIYRNIFVSTDNHECPLKILEVARGLKS